MHQWDGKTLSVGHDGEVWHFDRTAPQTVTLRTIEQAEGNESRSPEGINFEDLPDRIRQALVIESVKYVTKHSSISGAMGVAE